MSDALHESEDRYRLLADATLDALVTFDEDGAILFANQATEKVFGYSPGKLLGKNLALIVPDYSKHRPAANGGSPPPANRVELTGLHKKGEEISLEATFAMFLGKGKRYSTAIIRDISEQKRTQSALADAQRKLKSVLASSPGGQIIAESPAMLTLFDRVKKAAASYSGILIQGETGTGKE